MMTASGLSIGETVRLYRKRKHMSATALAAAANLSRCTIYRIENDKGDPTIDSLAKVLAVLDLQFVCTSAKDDSK